LRKLAAAFAALACLSSLAFADDSIQVTATKVASFHMLPQKTTFGALEWRGGIELKSPDDRFGGLSSIAIAGDGGEILAVSDRGLWFRAKLEYVDGRLSGIAEAELAPIRNDKGGITKGKVRNDAEAVALWEPGIIAGKVIVGYESRPRAGIFDLKRSGFAAPFRDLKLPKAVSKGPGNHELEAVGRFPKGALAGALIAISEDNRDAAGDIRAWVWGGRKSFEFTIKPFEDYLITDLAFLPDGNILTIERSFSSSSFPGMAIREISSADIIAGGAVAPREVFSGRLPFYLIDNMEGIAVFETPDGETRITVVSDNNYRTDLQRTLLLQFALKR
jgi:hypothetical protein